MTITVWAGAVAGSPPGSAVGVLAGAELAGAVLAGGTLAGAVCAGGECAGWAGVLGEPQAAAVSITAALPTAAGRGMSRSTLRGAAVITAARRVTVGNRGKALAGQAGRAQH